MANSASGANRAGLLDPSVCCPLNGWPRRGRPAPRIAFTMIMPDEKAKSAIAFLKAAVAYYNSLGVTVAGVMTDNGSCYKAFAFGRACKRLKLKHIRTRPYTPKTNGKAENLRWLNARVRECGRWRRYQLRRRTPAWSPRTLPQINQSFSSPPSTLGYNRRNVWRRSFTFALAHTCTCTDAHESDRSENDERDLVHCWKPQGSGFWRGAT